MMEDDFQSFLSTSCNSTKGCSVIFKLLPANFAEGSNQKQRIWDQEISPVETEWRQPTWNHVAVCVAVMPTSYHKLQLLL